MRIPLIGGAYQARSVIADAQRCLNLYAESNPKDAAAPFTYYPAPGLKPLVQAPNHEMVRGLYRATNGVLYAVIGPTLYEVSSSWVLTSRGTIVDAATPVSMIDNGLTLVLVDNSAAGYTLDLTSHAFAAISDAAFYGATRADILDGFLLFNKPNTPIFYCSDALATTFDPLYYASKSTYPDYLTAAVSIGQSIWLIGQFTTEVWFDSGASDFPFQRVPSAFINHGCAAPYSIATGGETVFWLSQSLRGDRIIFSGQGYQAERISTHAIESALAEYATVNDAVGLVYQVAGHSFYQLTFPTADATWVFDTATGLWHERCWIDNDGEEHRHRAQCAAFAYGINVAGDWQNGTLYQLDLDTYTDAGQPIKRLRSFPHMIQDGKRVMYRQFIADMESGTDAGTVTTIPPMVSLRWSDTRGASWSNPVTQNLNWDTAVNQSLGSAGQLLTSIQYQRLGMARDRVFELSWTVPVRTALNGAFVEFAAAGS